MKMFLTVLLCLLGSAITVFAQNAEPKFVLGTGYWQPIGDINWASRYKEPGFGDPTSTLDWTKMSNRIGEVFGRYNHRSGLFVKGDFGWGRITSGRMLDRDYATNQEKYSDYSGAIDGKTHYGSFDAGFARSVARGKLRVGGFYGYFVWKDRANMYGPYNELLGELDSRYSTDTLGIVYEPSWFAWRVGGELQAKLNRKWSTSVQVTKLVMGQVENKDSHVLRTAIDDLGPAPNVITESREPKGTQVEASVQYNLPQSITLCFGVRYWNFQTFSGQIRLGQYPTVEPLSRLSQSRAGLIFRLEKSF